MAPVNFLVQPQELDELNFKLDRVLALLERWDRERQEAASVTVPIRTTQGAEARDEQMQGLVAVRPAQPVAPKSRRRAERKPDDAEAAWQPAESRPAVEAVRERKPTESRPTAEAVRERKPTESRPTAEAVRERKLVESRPTAEAVRERKPTESRPTAETVRERKLAESRPTAEAVREPTRTYAQKSDEVEDDASDDEFIIKKVE
jgi:hypothetical protein